MDLPEDQRAEVTSKDQLIEQCKYIPVDLDKEIDAAFRTRLDFLSEPFTFAKQQTDVFAKTLAERMSGPPAVDHSLDDATEADRTDYLEEADRTEYMTEVDDQSVVELDGPDD
jgi:hypothetical protein